ncbi:unnamed protein product [Phyllotreta striolata]|uniref:Uncharacterized protein n=1 Tax=Phyllotreta striolata TaxID=444603 RepID=A0A9N9TSS9_PHYSR|nr:unnamed protein product [Phyllotreta striolata]
MSQSFYPTGLQRRDHREIPEQIPAGARRQDRTAGIRNNNKQTEFLLRRGRKGDVLRLLRGLLGLPHGLFDLPLQRDSLRKMFEKSFQIHSGAKRAGLRAAGAEIDRSQHEGLAGARGELSGQAPERMTHRVPLHAGVFHVKLVSYYRERIASILRISIYVYAKMAQDCYVICHVL